VEARLDADFRTLSKKIADRFIGGLIAVGLRRDKDPKKRWDGKEVWETWKETFETILLALKAYYPPLIARSEKMLAT
jgi:hypothetical protein